MPLWAYNVTSQRGPAWPCPKQVLQWCLWHASGGRRPGHHLAATSLQAL